MNVNRQYLYVFFLIFGTQFSIMSSDLGVSVLPEVLRADSNTKNGNLEDSLNDSWTSLDLYIAGKTDKENLEDSWDEIEEIVDKNEIKNPKKREAMEKGKKRFYKRIPHVSLREPGDKPFFTVSIKEDKTVMPDVKTISVDDASGFLENLSLDISEINPVQESVQKKIKNKKKLPKTPLEKKIDVLKIRMKRAEARSKIPRSERFKKWKYHEECRRVPVQYPVIKKPKIIEIENVSREASKMPSKRLEEAQKIAVKHIIWKKEIKYLLRNLYDNKPAEGQLPLKDIIERHNKLVETNYSKAHFSVLKSPSDIQEYNNGNISELSKKRIENFVRYHTEFVNNFRKIYAGLPKEKVKMSPRSFKRMKKKYVRLYRYNNAIIEWGKKIETRIAEEITPIPEVSKMFIPDTTATPETIMPKIPIDFAKTLVQKEIQPYDGKEKLATCRPGCITPDDFPIRIEISITANRGPRDVHKRLPQLLAMPYGFEHLALFNLEKK